MARKPTSIEICAGAGGQALGLEQAGFRHVACVENDPSACETLRRNRPQWNVVEADVSTWSYAGRSRVDLLAGGVPCPPFSKAGEQKGKDDERDLFPEVLRLARENTPRAVMIENVRGIFDEKFDVYRKEILNELESLGYACDWRLVQAADYGVPQLRPRSILLALRPEDADHFSWPDQHKTRATVGESLLPFMAANGWAGAEAWAEQADGVAPTLVGGSKKHGGADLGPTRAKRQWALQFGVNAKVLADAAPEPGYIGMPKLTVAMAAALQGFPSDWVFAGRKTAAYRQVGNAFPPPVAYEVGRQVRLAMDRTDRVRRAAATGRTPKIQLNTDT